MWHTFQDAAARLLEPAVLLVNLWEHTFKSHKCSSLKVDQVLTIGGATLWENYKRVVLVCLLTFLYPIGDLLLNEFFALLRHPV